MSSVPDTRPSEDDMIHVPPPPDLRCEDHEACLEILHALVGRIAQVESRVATLEKGQL